MLMAKRRPSEFYFDYVFDYGPMRKHRCKSWLVVAIPGGSYLLSSFAPHWACSVLPSV